MGECRTARTRGRRGKGERVLNAKSAHRQLVAASWTTPAQLQAFAKELGALSSVELVRLLPLLRAEGADGRRRARVQAFTLATEETTDPTLFLPALKACIQGDDRLRRSLLPLLVRTARDHTLDPVVDLLRSDDRELRRFAHKLLLETGHPGVLARLGRLIRGTTKAGKREAMELAARIGGPQAIHLLAPQVLEGELRMRQQALELLGSPEYFGEARREALEAIRPALSDPARAIALEGFNAFAALADPDEFYGMVSDIVENGDDRRLQLTAVQALARYERGDRTADVLGVIYRSSAFVRVRSAAVKALRLRKEPEVLPLLGEVLADDDRSIAQTAMAALERLHAAENFDFPRLILAILAGTSSSRLTIAREVMEKLGPPPPDLWPRLLQHLRFEDWWTRERVMAHLPTLAGSSISAYLIEWLADPSPVIRRYALEVFARLGDRRAVDAALEVASDDPDWWVRERAVECAAALGGSAVVPKLVELAHTFEDLLPAILGGLRGKQHAAALPLVIETLQHPDPGIRHQGVLTLSEVGEPSVAHVLFRLIEDEELMVRQAATDLLRRWKAENRSIETDLGGDLDALPLLLWHTTRNGGDDLFLRAGKPAYMKCMGQMVRLTDHIYSRQEVEVMIRSILTRVQTRQIEMLKDVDLSMELKRHGLRFRVNVHQQVSGWSAVFRRVSDTVHSFEDLGLPKLVEELCDLPHGLVVVGGPTGSGKSTTLAAMVGWINEHRGRHIVTVEDPIEVVHSHGRSVVSQREVGTHTHSFGNALRGTLRQDPDVILVGEMRDPETMSFAVTAAETGHLVLATLHTSSARNSIDRIIDAFPAAGQPQIRAMLSQTLRAVICQQLLRRTDGRGRIPALEILVNTEPVAASIRKGTTFNLPSMIETGRSHGMQSMDEELRRLVAGGTVHPSEAYLKSQRKADFDEYLSTKGLEAGHGRS